ncbi:MAG TPA: LysM peptidoglycan-binding domain-containing protein [Pyrinomonadaceae bacterium]|nr:LysM peptidoglycan-binding domain-containing protein [Pyrinomonadaceae bacterium]
MPTKKSAASKSRAKAAKKKTAAKKTSSKKAGLTPARIQAQQDYTTRSGDTLKSVAAKFKVPSKFLARANNVSESATFSAGMVLRIPALKFGAFGQDPNEGWVEIAPIWYQKGPTFGDDRILVGKVSGTRFQR